ncbi:hypothetical protein CKA38_07065 [Ereboglobus luteus]|uniref:RNA polymerase subunit sigma-24 n=1 Tax=Ereboglobus luteus TaxID=1796921 RepID=A0A2U8E3C6_9BACT|nr:hypothetical protein CKA38_07065 [Ereboglobus luteus]
MPNRYSAAHEYSASTSSVFARKSRVFRSFNLDKQNPVDLSATSQPDIRQATDTTCARNESDDIAALTETVRKAQTGDEDAQRTLILAYQHRVAGFIYTITNRGDSVEDLAQIVFIKMIRALPRLVQPAQFEAWLFRLARNACIDHIRRQRWQKFLTPIETEERVLDIPDKPSGVDTEELDALNHAIAKLKPKDRALIALAQEGRSQVEMAEITGVSVVALKARLHRAREQLKHYYENTN